VQANAAVTFGVQFAHRHFDTLGKETLREQLDMQNRRLTTGVVLFNALTGDESPVAWRITNGGLIVPTAWCVLPPESTATKVDLRAKLTMISEFFVLKGLTSALTVRLLDASIPTRPSEAALEITDEVARTQIIRPAPLSTVEARQASTCRFDPDDGHPIVMTWCQPNERVHNGDVDEENEGELEGE
jgi:hypothetical protein